MQNIEELSICTIRSAEYGFSPVCGGHGVPQPIKIALLSCLNLAASDLSQLQLQVVDFLLQPTHFYLFLCLEKVKRSTMEVIII